MSEKEPLLPLDERFREAEQYQLELHEPQKPKQPQAAEAVVCIGYCNNCKYCDNSANQ